MIEKSDNSGLFNSCTNSVENLGSAISYNPNDSPCMTSASLNKLNKLPSLVF